MPRSAPRPRPLAADPLAEPFAATDGRDLDRLPVMTDRICPACRIRYLPRAGACLCGAPEPA